MTLFNLLWNLTIGIIGGVFSSIIVSRIFFIHEKYQGQLMKFEELLQKVGYIAGMFSGIKTVLEFSYDSEVKMQAEMKVRGFKTEDEYYIAHRDRDWISKEDLLHSLLLKTQEIAKNIEEALLGVCAKEQQLNTLFSDMKAYAMQVVTLKECTFATVREVEQQSTNIKTCYDKYKKSSNKILLKMVLTDKAMIILFVLLLLVFVGTFLCYHFGV